MIAMDTRDSRTRPVEVATVGERLSGLRLCSAGALAAMRRSLLQYGQLGAVTLFADGDRLEVIDGFKRVRAARALGWRTLVAHVDPAGAVDAKLRLRELAAGSAFTELEEGWLVRSLYHEDGLSQPQIARRMGRDKSWVWRRLMLAEALEPVVQADVRLGLIVPRAAVAVSRLPRGNQRAASAVVVRRGLTVRQAELLVGEVLALGEPEARSALLERRLEGPLPQKPPGPRPSRAMRNEADWMSSDILRVHELAARLQARLLSTPLAALTPPAAELIGEALVRLQPVLRALDGVIASVMNGRVSA